MYIKWKYFKETGIPDYLTCLLRNLYAGQEATVRTGHGTMNWFYIGKGVCQGCILSPCLFNLYAEYINQNARLDEAQVEIKIAGRNINNLRYADDTTLMAEREEELKSLLMKVKVESEKAGLKVNIQKVKIMASGPITSWEIDGETMQQWQILFFRATKSLQMVTAAMKLKDTWSLEEKLWPNIGSILKIRDITLPTKVHVVKAMVFPVVAYGCESWTLKKAERWTIDAFELWCWRRLLRVPWSARRFNQSVNPKGNQCWILIGRTDAEVEAPILWPLDVKNWLIGKDWCQERLKARGEGDKRGWDGWMASPTWWTWVWASSRSWWWTGKPGVLRSMGSQRVGHKWATELKSR